MAVPPRPYRPLEPADPLDHRQLVVDPFDRRADRVAEIVIVDQRRQRRRPARRLRRGPVLGEAGVGKTALVDVFVERLRGRHDALVGRGQCVVQIGDGEAYLPLLDAFGVLGRGVDGRRVRDVLRTVAPTWLLQLPAVVEPADVEALRVGAVGMSAERMLRERWPALADSRYPALPEELEFVHAEDVLARWPDLPRKERETRLLAELERALAYPKLRQRIPADAASDFVALLRSAAIVAADPGELPRRSADPGDDYLPALAESERAVLVSGDEHLLRLAASMPVRAPRAFLQSLESIG